MTTASEPLHHAIVFVDVEGFTAAYRNQAAQRQARAGLYKALRRAFRQAKIPWPRLPWLGFLLLRFDRLRGTWFRFLWRKGHREDRGDGALMLIPPTVSMNRLVAELSPALAAEIARYNETCDRKARIRLRVVVHAGEVSFDKDGVVGHAINNAKRLLDAQEFKDALARQSDAVLAIIASLNVYNDVIRHEPICEPDIYREIRLKVNNTRTSGLIRLLQDPRPAPPPAAHPAPPGRLLAGGVACVEAVGVFLLVSGEIPPAQCDMAPAQIRVLASAEKEAVIREVAREFERSYRGPDHHCRMADVLVAAMPYTGAAQQAIERGWLDDGLVPEVTDDNKRERPFSNEADVWLPDSSLEVDQVNVTLKEKGLERTIRLETKGSFAQSLLVAAVPEDMAKAIGLSGRRFAWREALAWPRGDFFLGRANPRTSSVGLAATAGLYQAVLERDVLNAKALNAPGDPQRLHNVEHAITQVDDESLKVLCDMRASSAQSDRRRTAFLVSEKSVVDYRRKATLGGRCSGTPAAEPLRLAPFYPEEGAPVLDHPYVVVNRHPSASPARRQVIEDFFGYLRRFQAQQILRGAGYRDMTGRLDGQDPPSRSGRLRQTYRGRSNISRCFGLGTRCASRRRCCSSSTSRGRCPRRSRTSRALA